MEATELALPKIVRNYENKHPGIVCVDKLTMFIPLTNALSERGTNHIKRIKNQMLSTMKNGLLNALLLISMNGNNCGSDEAERYQSSCLLL